MKFQIEIVCNNCKTIDKANPLFVKFVKDLEKAGFNLDKAEFNHEEDAPVGETEGE